MHNNSLFAMYDYKLSMLINNADICLNLTRLVSKFLYSSAEIELSRLYEWFDILHEMEVPKQRLINLIKVSFWLDVVSVNNKDIRIYNTLNKQNTDLSVMLHAIQEPFLQKYSNLAYFDFVWDQILTYSNESEMMNIRVYNYFEKSNLVTQNFKFENGFYLNDYIFMEMKRMYDHYGSEFESILLEKLQHCKAPLEKYNAICKVYLVYLYFVNYKVQYSDFRRHHRFKYMEFYNNYENYIYLLRQEEEQAVQIDNPIFYMTQFILDDNYRISEFVKNIVYINHEIIESTVKNYIRVYKDLLHKMLYKKTNYPDKKNYMYISMQNLFLEDKKTLTEEAVKLLTDFNEFNRIMCNLIEYFDLDYIEGNQFLYLLNSIAIEDSGLYPEQVWDFLESTKRRSSSSSNKLIHIVLDVVHAFCFIDKAEYDDDSLVGKCYTNCVKLIYCILNTVSNPKKNLDYKVNKLATFKSYYFFFYNFMKFRIDNKIFLNNDICFDVIALYYDTLKEFQKDKELRDMYNQKFLAKIFYKVLDGTDYNRRTINYNNIINQIGNIIQFNVIENNPKILQNLVKYLSKYFMVSFEKATFENESKQIKFILTKIQTMYNYQDYINKYISNKTYLTERQYGIFDIIANVSLTAKDKAHLLALLASNYLVYETIFKLLYSKYYESKVDVTKYGIAPKNLEYIVAIQLKTQSDVCEYLDSWLIKHIEFYRTDCVWYIVYYFATQYSNYYEHYNSYSNLDTSSKSRHKFTQEKVEEVLKVYEFVFQNKYFLRLKYKVFDECRKIIEYSIKGVAAGSIVENIEFNYVYTFLYYYLYYFNYSRKEMHEEQATLLKEFTKFLKDIEKILLNHKDHLFNFYLYAMDMFSLLVKRCKKLELISYSKEIKKTLKQMAGRYSSCIYGTETYIVAHPLSPHTIYKINEFSKLDTPEKTEKPKFKKPNELHTQYEEIPVKTIRNYEFPHAEDEEEASFYFKVILNVNYSINFKVLFEYVFEDEIDYIANHYFECSKPLVQYILSQSESADSNSFYEVSKHLLLVMKECPMKTNLIDYMYADLLNIYINCNIFDVARDNINILRIWMEIINLILIHSSQKGEMIELIFEKEPSSGLMKLFDKNYDRVKNQYYRKIAFLVYSADNAFFNYKLSTIIRIVMENCKVDKGVPKNTAFVVLNLFILRMVYLKTPQKELEVYWNEVSYMLTNFITEYSKMNKAQKGAMGPIISHVLMFIEELYNYNSNDVHRQNFILYFELFGLESDILDSLKKDIYKSNLNLLENLMEFEGTAEDKDKYYQTFNKKGDYNYKQDEKAYLMDFGNVELGENISDLITAKTFHLINHLVSLDFVKYELNWEKIHAKVENEFLYII